jgi:hypothetical protein
VARYIRKLKHLGSLGPSEERGAGLWVGYDLEGIDADLSDAGLVRVEEWPAEQLTSYGVTTFLRVGEDDHATREKLLAQGGMDSASR